MPYVTVLVTPGIRLIADTWSLVNSCSWREAMIGYALTVGLSFPRTPFSLMLLIITLTALTLSSSADAHKRGAHLSDGDIGDVR